MTHHLELQGLHVPPPKLKADCEFYEVVAFLEEYDAYVSSGGKVKMISCLDPMLLSAMRPCTSTIVMVAGWMGSPRASAMERKPSSRSNSSDGKKKEGDALPPEATSAPADPDWTEPAQIVQWLVRHFGPHSLASAHYLLESRPLNLTEVNPVMLKGFISRFQLTAQLCGEFKPTEEAQKQLLLRLLSPQTFVETVLRPNHIESVPFSDWPNFVYSLARSYVEARDTTRSVDSHQMAQGNSSHRNRLPSVDVDTSHEDRDESFDHGDKLVPEHDDDSVTLMSQEKNSAAGRPVAAAYGTQKVGF